MEQNKKKCPYCGEEIMADAKKCRHCGEWLDTTSKNTSTNNVPPVKKSKGKKILFYVGGIVVVTMIVIATIIFSNGSDSKPSSDMTTPSDQEMVNGNMTADDSVEIVELDENSEIGQQIKSLHGEYLANADAFLGDVEIARQYGKYFINFNDFTITYYSWDNNHDKWVQSYKTTYEVDGYNYLIYTNENGNKVTMYTGDLNEDGKMDIWLTDNIFWTKQ